jgi:hypothetical protein
MQHMYFGDIKQPAVRKQTTRPDTAFAEPKPTPLPRRSVGLNGRKRRLLVLWSGCAAVAVLTIAGGVLFYLHRNAGPLPASITKNARFALYYPTSAPTGYSYQKGSANIQNGYVVYKLQDDSSSITVSEQAAPATPPNLGQLAGFTSLKTIAGNAAVGTSNKRPIVIIASNTTLILITGQQGMPQDVVAEVAQNMRSLSQ